MASHPNLDSEEPRVAFDFVDFVAEKKGSGLHLLSLFRGHTPDLVKQLVEKSKQPHIADPLNCPRDSTERFANPEAFEKWRQKGGGRTTYFLTRDDGDLAGIVWYGTEPTPEAIGGDAPNPQCTFAIRMYEGYDGKGSAQEFIETSLADFVAQLPAEQVEVLANGVHLETNVANLGAQRLYEKVGWREVHRTGNEDIAPADRRVIMILSPQRILDIYHRN